MARHELDFVALWSTTAHAHALVVASDPEQALRRIEESRPLLERVRGLVSMTLWLDAVQAYAVCETGNLQRATTLCADVLERMRRHGMRLHETMVLRALGRCHAAAGDAAAARGCLELN